MCLAVSLDHLALGRDGALKVDRFWSNQSHLIQVTAATCTHFAQQGRTTPVKDGFFYWNVTAFDLVELDDDDDDRFEKRGLLSC